MTEHNKESSPHFQYLSVWCLFQSVWPRHRMGQKFMYWRWLCFANTYAETSWFNHEERLGAEDTLWLYGQTQTNVTGLLAWGHTMTIWPDSNQRDRAVSMRTHYDYMARLKTNATGLLAWEHTMNVWQDSNQHVRAVSMQSKHRDMFSFQLLNQGKIVQTRKQQHTELLETEQDVSKHALY